MKRKKIKKLINYTLLSVSFLILCFLIFLLLKKPSNSLDWSPDQAVLGYYERNGSIISAYNIRNITYTTTKNYSIHYYNETYDLNKLDSVYLMIEPFNGEWAGIGHALLTYGFDDGRYLSVSIEARREKGVPYSPYKGLLRNYELMYVLSDENDVIKLRSNYRNDSVYLYPVNLTKEESQKALISMLDKANSLKQNPEFYNTFTSGCLSEALTHVNKASPGKVPFSLSLLAPGIADKYLYMIGFFKTSKNFEKTKQECRINDAAMKFSDPSEFSKMIRCSP